MRPDLPQDQILSLTARLRASDIPLYGGTCMDARELIEQGKTALGIEFGSTRIKGVLIDYDGNVLATGGYEWENSLVDGVWTYALEDADKGMRACYRSLRQEVEEKYGVTPVTFGAIGISAMMHGYIALDKDDHQIARFQTWRNTNTPEAAGQLTELFQFNVPLRWSISQLYQDEVKGIKSGYAKFETFPVWSLPLKHPVNIAYEAATADLNDVNMIDPYHLEAYGKTTVNYNRDVEVFPVLNAMFEKIEGVIDAEITDIKKISDLQTKFTFSYSLFNKKERQYVEEYVEGIGGTII